MPFFSLPFSTVGIKVGAQLAGSKTVSGMDARGYDLFLRQVEDGKSPKETGLSSGQK